MSTHTTTIQTILGYIHGAGCVTAKRMFGEYAIYYEDKTVALVCDNQLYVKATDGCRQYIPGAETGFPFPGAKMWLVVPEHLWDRHGWLLGLFQLCYKERQQLAYRKRSCLRPA